MGLLSSESEPKHTWSEFKNKVNSMDTSEKQDFLKQLQLERMEAYAQRFHNPNVARIRTLRKKIAYMKTILHMKGYSYVPRGEKI